MDCLFCRIAEGSIPSTKVYEDEQVLAFRDIEPQAPTHVLLIPQKHIVSFQQTGAEDDALLLHCVRVLKQLALELGIADSGYRIITNVGDDAGQSVKHLHFHLIGGKPMKWDN